MIAIKADCGCPALDKFVTKSFVLAMLSITISRAFWKRRIYRGM